MDIVLEFSWWCRSSCRIVPTTRTIKNWIYYIYFKIFLYTVVNQVRGSDAGQVVVRAYLEVVNDGCQLKVYVVEDELVRRSLYLLHLRHLAVASIPSTLCSYYDIVVLIVLKACLAELDGADEYLELVLLVVDDVLAESLLLAYELFTGGSIEVQVVSLRTIRYARVEFEAVGRYDYLNECVQ